MPNQPLINRLEKALNDQLFDVYFQPQVDLQTHQIIGAEALGYTPTKVPKDPQDFATSKP